MELVRKGEVNATTGFGTGVATAGNKHHWMLRLNGNLPGWQYDIGILDVETAKGNPKKRMEAGGFWFTKAGYLYYDRTSRACNGDVKNNSIAHGQTCGGGVVIDAWLVPKDENKTNLISICAQNVSKKNSYFFICRLRF